VCPTFQPRINRKSLRLVTAPGAEPVALADVKVFLRVDGTDEDSLINLLMSSARRMAEEYTQRAFITQSWEMTTDGFSPCDPDAFFPGVVQLPYNFFTGIGEFFNLGRGPIQSITSIMTYDTDNSSTVVDSSVYRLDAPGERVVLNDDQTWPTNLRRQDAVVVVYVAGYGNAGSSVPEPIRQAIIQQVAAMYEDRKTADLMPGVKTLLTPFMSAGALVPW
jgi:Phage gp6-like head-tail connector protein